MNINLSKSLAVFALFVAFCGSVTAASQQTDAQVPLESPNDLGRTLLFNKGDMGSRFWRIPALVTTGSGTVIAVADRRNSYNRDLANRIDLVGRRSLDGGRTWLPPQEIVVAPDSMHGYGDAVLAYHQPSGRVVMVAAHGNGVFESTPDNYTRVVVMYSDDEGLTWSVPRDITDQIFSPSPGGAPIAAQAGFATSGRMLCTDSGTLMFVLASRTGPRRWGPVSCFVVSSDDGGDTWTVNPTPVDTNGNEAKLAQLADGSLLLSVRNRSKGPRRMSRSYDGGNTWTPLELDPQLTDPSCNGDMMFVSVAELQQLADSGHYSGPIPAQGILLHSLADDPDQRRNVVVKLSTDSGHTWHTVWSVCPTPSSYSALTLTHDGQLLCLTEENAADDTGFRLWLSSKSLSELVSR